MARALRELARVMPPERVDRIWIFPPLTSGRKETGVVAAGCYTDGPRHLLVTVAYRAEETGRGVEFHHALHEEGEAPADRLPGIMTGVVKRLRQDPADPASHDIAGDARRFHELVGEWDPEGPEVAAQRPGTGSVIPKGDASGPEPSDPQPQTPDPTPFQERPTP